MLTDSDSVISFGRERHDGETRREKRKNERPKEEKRRRERVRDGRVDGGGGGRGADDPPIEKSDASRVASASAARRSRTS